MKINKCIKNSRFHLYGSIGPVENFWNGKQSKCNIQITLMWSELSQYIISRLHFILLNKRCWSDENFGDVSKSMWPICCPSTELWWTHNRRSNTQRRGQENVQCISRICMLIILFLNLNVHFSCLHIHFRFIYYRGWIKREIWSCSVIA